ncbi:MAG: RNA methyltransferase [Candidatus Bathyarchaeota archaeon]
MPLSVALPASLVSDVPHLREKTSHLGMVGRALAIFRVNEVIIYRDRPAENQRWDVELISTILNYMETPQYLRKHLFPTMPLLQYAGVLPPLRTPHHPLTKRIVDLKDEEYRDGVIVKTDKETLVDIGVERPIPLNERNIFVGQRITVKIFKDMHGLTIKKVEGPIVDKIYWGYRVNVTGSTLGQMLRMDLFDLVVLTSRYGKPLTEVIEELRNRWKEDSKILIAFGSPKQGLKNILEHEGLKMKDVNALLTNTIPKQGTETVRTEEALYATLAVINIII